MLKIRDNVDLKELEKFGFRYRPTFYIQWLKDLQVMNVRLEPILYGEENKYFYVSVNNEGEDTGYDFETLIYIFEDYAKKLKEDIEEIKKLFNDMKSAGIIEEVEEDCLWKKHKKLT